MKVSKSLIFLVKSFLSTFIDIWRFFTGHTEDDKCSTLIDSLNGLTYSKSIVYSRYFAEIVL